MEVLNLDVSPETNQAYYQQFPLFTIRDMIRSYQLLKTFLELIKFIWELEEVWEGSNY
jgi:homoserine acetyltransferase